MNTVLQNKGWLAVLVDSVTRIIGLQDNGPILPLTAPPSPPPSPTSLARDVWFPAYASAQAPVLPIHVGQ